MVFFRIRPGKSYHLSRDPGKKPDARPRLIHKTVPASTPTNALHSQAGQAKGIALDTRCTHGQPTSSPTLPECPLSAPPPLPAVSQGRQRNSRNSLWILARCPKTAPSCTARSRVALPRSALRSVWPRSEGSPLAKKWDIRSVDCGCGVQTCH